MNEEQHLGIIFMDLEYFKQCLAAKNKELYLVLCIMKRNYVRPDLEYPMQFGASVNAKDADMFKGVQRRATEIIPSLRNLYEETLKRLGMFSPRHRRLRGI